MDSPSRPPAAGRPSNSSSQVLEAAPKPALLPAFEPLSSSPFPRPQSAKRKFEEHSPSFPKQQLKYYPTPVPTSSTGIITSSSPQHVRPGLQRTVSALSERVPLGAVPSITLPPNGEVLRMGRSSNSSDYQLSANRLISRVHVQAAYHAPSASNSKGYVQIECLGWNGAKIHCLGRVYDLAKGESYVSEDPDAEIMLDVQDTRVIIGWPVEQKLSWESPQNEGSWTEEDSSPCRPTQNHFASSPPMIPRSPVSQSPIRQPIFTGHSLVQVYEDAEADDQENEPPAVEETFIQRSPSVSEAVKAIKSSPRHGSTSSFEGEDFSDNDEENDPVVHSFGPFGDNLLPRMASFSTTTPRQPSAQRDRRPLATAHSPQKKAQALESISESATVKHINESPIKNHVINQLAFSRLHSMPLSMIHKHLPTELKDCTTVPAKDKDEKDCEASTSTTPFTRQDLKRLMDAIPCVGEISRSGKDAAGKPLENEFYYVPEMDTNDMRRDAVTGGMRGTGLRAVRKSHKQYYWKRPRV